MCTSDGVRTHHRQQNAVDVCRRRCVFTSTSRRCARFLCTSDDVRTHRRQQNAVDVCRRRCVFTSTSRRFSRFMCTSDGVRTHHRRERHTIRRTVAVDVSSHRLTSAFTFHVHASSSSRLRSKLNAAAPSTPLRVFPHLPDFYDHPSNGILNSKPNFMLLV